ncbi:hypothetical protein DL764_000910 [Monosporascus ibericus]|uniref:Uncharacterized protein n=1 Tax=Monosporascus ibericus TaxID=155417 RepID=A0A4Q4TTE4_9PEZI|nr:hypothetical protein DL764_000910 [Monosporascus ibericus]
MATSEPTTKKDAPAPGDHSQFETFLHEKLKPRFLEILRYDPDEALPIQGEGRWSYDEGAGCYRIVLAVGVVLEPGARDTEEVEAQLEAAQVKCLPEELADRTTIELCSYLVDHEKTLEALVPGEFFWKNWG